ncbi:hypothetical protein BDV95DRAFT_84874 [Massariosphaeria phaeospora]|uniref:Uncharacterized protein n=1 Tax=Massariosphaeria phaeospora TaxID=100035 RepID=A0A7C8ML59_9PLEO|nr:hypothetical protein BDV95DRAFT_84874 [Massariosphaeria phaeospora]
MSSLQYRKCTYAHHPSHGAEPQTWTSRSPQTAHPHACPPIPHRKQSTSSEARIATIERTVQCLPSSTLTTSSVRAHLPQTAQSPVQSGSGVRDVFSAEHAACHWYCVLERITVSFKRPSWPFTARDAHLPYWG